MTQLENDDLGARTSALNTRWPHLSDTAMDTMSALLADTNRSIPEIAVVALHNRHQLRNNVLKAFVVRLITTHQSDGAHLDMYMLLQTLQHCPQLDEHDLYAMVKLTFDDDFWNVSHQNLSNPAPACQSYFECDCSTFEYSVRVCPTSSSQNIGKLGQLNMVFLALYRDT